MSTIQEGFARLRKIMADNGGDRGEFDPRLNIIEAVLAFEGRYLYSMTDEMKEEIDRCETVVWYRKKYFWHVW